MKRIVLIITVLVLLIAVISCSNKKSDKVTHLEIIDMTTNEVIGLGESSKQISFSKDDQNKVKDDLEREASFELYEYDGLKLGFFEDKLVFIRVSDEAGDKDRFKTKSNLGIGNSMSEIEEIYGRKAIYNEFFQYYYYILVESKDNEFIYLDSMDELPADKNSYLGVYWIEFKMDENNKARSIHIVGEEVFDPDYMNSW
jgi:hypothetical protein